MLFELNGNFTDSKARKAGETCDINGSKKFARGYNELQKITAPQFFFKLSALLQELGSLC